MYTYRENLGIGKCVTKHQIYPKYPALRFCCRN